MPFGRLERIYDEVVRAADGDLARVAMAHPVAVGWATVELDRAALELGHDLGIPEASFRPAADSIALGADCRVAEAALPGGLSLALLEPNTEGRLVATLARSDEGPAVVWLAADDPVAAADALRLAGIGLSPDQAGPLGSERLVLGRSVFGPHWLLLGSAPGTIRP